jgi:20S proteasome subunit alpha 7
VSADGRQVVDRARDEAQNYRDTYGHRIPPSALAGRLGLYMHYFTLHGSLRPFGCSVLIACFDEETQNHELYAVDPSGTTLKFFGIAVGKGTQAAKTELEKLPLNEMSCREAMREIARMYVARALIG